MDKDVRISVIVPVYNEEKHLENCLNSILNQSFKDFELILVDDASTDKSFEICQAYQKKDNRIVLHQKENGGQGSARNLALKVAKGDYIMFVDADDALGPDTLLDNYEILKNNSNIDCLQFPIYRNYGTKEAFIDKGKTALYSHKDDFKSLLLGKSIISWIVCDKIFKKEVLKELYFPEDMIYEDNYFMLDLVEKLNCVYISEKGLYYYYKRKDSTTTSEITMKSELSTLRVLMHALDKLRSPHEKGMYLKYLIRLINVDKSLRINFNHFQESVKDYKSGLSIGYIFKTHGSFKYKMKLMSYKFFR